MQKPICALVIAFTVTLTAFNHPAYALNPHTILTPTLQTRTPGLHNKINNFKDTSYIGHVSYRKIFQPSIFPSTILKDFAKECETTWNPVLNFAGAVLFVIDGLIEIVQNTSGVN